MDLDTFLVTVYTRIDDLYRTVFAPQRPRRRGARPQMSDSEVLTVVICAQWSGRSERRFLRFVQRYWQAYFPRLLSQSAFNRRCHDLRGVLIALGPQLASQIPAGAYAVLDSVPVPLARRCRGRRHRLFADEAAIGWGGSDGDRYYGCRLLVVAAQRGPITGWTLGPADTDDRWLAEACFCWRADPLGAPRTAADLPPSHRRGGGYVGPTGPIRPRAAAGLPCPGPYLADRGFAGRNWIAPWTARYGAPVLTHRSYGGDADTRAVRRQHSRLRQRIEGVLAHLAATFHLPFPRARTDAGLLLRIGAKIAAFNLAVLLNLQLGRPPYAFADLAPC